MIGLGGVGPGVHAEDAGLGVLAVLDERALLISDGFWQLDGLGEVDEGQRLGHGARIGGQGQAAREAGDAVFAADFDADLVAAGAAEALAIDAG